MDEIIAEIDRRIGEIKSDPRFKYPPARVQINAPLALIQQGMESRLQELESMRAFILEHPVIGAPAGLSQALNSGDGTYHP